MESDPLLAPAKDKTHRDQCLFALQYPCHNILVHTVKFTPNRKFQGPSPPIHGLVWAVSNLGHVRALAQEHQLLRRSGRNL
jgi:hypothetical protein